MPQNTMRSIRQAKSAMQAGKGVRAAELAGAGAADHTAPQAMMHMAIVHPKPVMSTARAELSREVRIALDGLATRGVTSPRRTVRNSHASGVAPFICG